MHFGHWYVCIVRCGDGTLYTDVASDPEEAVRKFNYGEGNAYVRARRPVFLAYQEEYMNERDARSRADAVRRMSRERKESLLALQSYAAVADAYRLTPRTA